MERATQELIVILLVMSVLLVFAIVCVIIFFRVMLKESRAEKERLERMKQNSSGVAESKESISRRG